MNIKKGLSIVICLSMFFALMPAMTVTASAQTKTITKASQLRNLHYKSKGFGPGSYKIGRDIDLGDNGTNACVPLISGKYTIDFNGYSVRSTYQKIPTFSIGGADVTFKDSRVKSNKASISSAALACVGVKKGKVTILSGNYVNAWNSDNVCLELQGGTTLIKGGQFIGVSDAAAQGAGKLRIAGGYFLASEGFGLSTTVGCDIKILKGRFYSQRNVLTNGYGVNSAIGIMSYGYYRGNGSDLLASGSSFSSAVYPYRVGFFNTDGNGMCVSNSNDIRVVNSVKVGKVKIRKPARSRRAVTARWARLSGVSGYQVKYSAKKSMSSSKIKTAGASKRSLKIGSLKKGKRYYLRVRAYKNVNGMAVYGAWSDRKSAVAK